MKFALELLAVAAIVGTAAVRADDTFPVMSPPPYEPTTAQDTAPTTTTSYPSGDSPTPPPTCGNPDCSVVAATAIPSCAHGCFAAAAPEAGCDAADYACQCNPATREKLGELLLPCLATYCTEDDIPDVLAGANEVCECAKETGDCGGSGGHPTLPSTYPPTSTSTKEPEQPTYPPYPTCGGDGPKCPDDAHPTDAYPTDGYPTDVYPTDVYPTDKHPTDKHPTDKYPTDKYPTDKYPTDKYPTGGPDKYPSKPTACHEVTLTVYPTAPTTGTPTAVKPCKDLADQLEACAKPCFEEAIPKTGCALDDYACQCAADAHKTLEEKLLPCLAKACDAKVLPNLASQAAAVCECAAKEADGQGHDEDDNEKHGYKPLVTVTTTCYPVGPTFDTYKPTPAPTYKPTTTGGSKPVVTAGAVGRYEISAVAGVLGAALAVAVGM